MKEMMSIVHYCIDRTCYASKIYEIHVGKRSNGLYQITDFENIVGKLGVVCKKQLHISYKSFSHKIFLSCWNYSFLQMIVFLSFEDH